MFGRNKEPKIDYKKQRRKLLLKDMAGDVADKIGSLKKYFLMAIVIIIAGFGIFLFNNDKIFLVQDIQIVGIVRVDSKDILNLLDVYKGKNILKIRPGEIENLIKSKYGEVLAVYVSKDITGLIKVDIVESTPVVVVVSKDKISLLNNRAMEVGSLPAPKIELTGQESSALDGKLKEDDPSVKKRFEEDQANIDAGNLWSKATKEDKDRYIDMFKSEAQGKINAYFEQAQAVVSQSVYSDLVRLLDKTGIGEEVSETSIEFVLKIQELILKIPLNIIDIDYRAGDTFVFDTDTGKQLLFYPRRPALDQVRDLNVLISSGEYNNLSIIDFRTEKYSGI
ncbi:MAG: FtsQ-type POTRA domain-containing protein [Candidatus Dojkabacteria bacterium]